MKFGIYFAFLAVLVWPLSCTRTVDNSDQDTVVYEDTGPLDGLPGEDSLESGEDTIPGVDTSTPGEWTISGFQQDQQGLTCPEDTSFLNLYSDILLTDVVALSGLYSSTDTLDGIFVHDGVGGPYSGISVVFDKGLVAEIKPGDVLDIGGEVLEYYCNTQLKASSITIKGEVAVPAAEAVDTELVSSDGDSEQYEGCYVTFENVIVTGSNAQWGSFTIGDSLYVEPTVYSFELPGEGCAFSKLSGVVLYSFDKYRLLPLSAEDMVLDPDVECTPIEPEVSTVYDIQNSEASLACTDEQFVNVPGTFVLEGLEVTSPSFEVAGKTSHVLQEQEGGPFSGVLVMFEGTDPALAVGDLVNIDANWTEYYCLTELKATSFEKTGIADALIVPELVETSIFSSADTAEEWEGVLVTLENVEVVEADDGYGNLVVNDGLIIDDQIFGEFDIAAGTAFQSITGIVSFGWEQYRILPRTQDDMVQ